jgi:Ion channel
MFEHRTKPLLPRRAFYGRMARSAGVALIVIVAALGIGMLGYRCFERMSWLDAFANASMILSGMGPFAPLQTDAGKLFAGCYALFSGLMFITSLGIVFAPLFHRFLHKFHLEQSRVDRENGQ